MLRPTIYRPSPLTGLIQATGASQPAPAPSGPDRADQPDETAPARERRLVAAATA